MPNEEYEGACRDFLTQTLDSDRPARVVQDIAAFVERIAAAGAVNGLSQTLLKLTSPGVPDLYQGTEYWDFSLVDPDNRRPVDFAARAASLQADAAPAELLADWRDGRVKQAVIARALRLRKSAPGLFTQGSYTPLKIEGPAKDHALGFARVHDGYAAIVLVTRLPGALPPGKTLPVPDWKGTYAVIPRNFVTRRIFDAMANEIGAPRELTGRLPLEQVLEACPVALLEVR
jgi:(1->4)-alpha-D-glucan 1-alpha-D-glucosylmutase